MEQKNNTTECKACKEREKRHSFLGFLTYLKAQGAIQNFEYNKEDGSAKIQPHFSVLPVYHLKVYEQWDI